MQKTLKYLRENFTYVALTLLFLFFLFNPVFKKYDYGSEWASVLGFCLVLPLLFVARRGEEIEQAGEGARSTRWEKIFFGIFAGMVALSFAYSQTKNVGLSEVMAYLSCFGVYFLLAHSKISFERRFLRIVVFATIGACMMGFFLYIFRQEPRMFGPFFNLMHHGNLWPNAFALFLLMAWPLFIITGYSRFLPIVFAALLLTFSRGALIAFGGQLVIVGAYWLWTLRAERKKMSKILLGVLITGVCTGAIFYFTNYLRAFNNPVINIEERATFQNAESLTSKQERVDFWKSAIELAKEKPLTGWGPFSFRYANYPIQKTFLGASDHPHNILLKMAAENGMVAAGAFLAFLGSVFWVVGRRFGRLEAGQKQKVVLLGTAILGALAHSLIDYNFNFMVTLLLFFMLLAIFRSSVIGGQGRGRFPFGVFMVIVMLSMLSVYELGLGVANKLSENKIYLDYSLFPRNNFLNRADAALASGDFETALTAAEKEIALNPLDAQAWYLRGVTYCKEDFAKYDQEKCVESFTKALAINPMNDFNYYAAYIDVVGESDKETLQRAVELLKIYFEYVEQNVHFTAFTPNVEAAAALVEVLGKYLPGAEQKELEAGSAKMLETAERLRRESNKIL